MGRSRQHRQPSLRIYLPRILLSLTHATHCFLSQRIVREPYRRLRRLPRRARASSSQLPSRSSDPQDDDQEAAREEEDRQESESRAQLSTERIVEETSEAGSEVALLERGRGRGSRRYDGRRRNHVGRVISRTFEIDLSSSLSRTQPNPRSCSSSHELEREHLCQRSSNGYQA